MEYKDVTMPKDAEAKIKKFAQELIQAGLVRENSTRFILGIAGIPASGKSTFATMLVASVNRLKREKIAQVIPMDGFHLPNNVLEERGLRVLKGIPETFNAKGFVELLRHLREDQQEPIWGPIYDRTLHAPVDNAVEISPSIRFIVTEGNYLLLNTPPWHEVRDILDQIWYLDTPREVTIKRLMQRHLTSGRTEQEAIEKINGTDLPNSDLIEETHHRADRIIRLEADC